MANYGMSRRRFLTNAAKAGIVVPTLGMGLASCRRGNGEDEAGVPSPAVEQDGPTEITVPINESPWLHSFEALVDIYEEETGNTVNLRVFEFGALQTQQINAMAQGSTDFDILQINEPWTGQFYQNGWVTPLREIDPEFEWDPSWIEYDGAGRWLAEENTTSTAGEPMALPINGNIQLFQYRRDIYEDLGLAVPETFEDAIENGRAAMDAGAIDYGYVIRAAANTHITFNFGPLLHGYEEDWFADPDAGDWTPTINSDAAKEAMASYLKLGELGPPEPQGIGHAEMSSLLQTGRSLQSHMVAATHSNNDDPAQSAVAGKVGYALVPRPQGGVHATHSGIWVMGIPPQIDDGQKRASYNFLRWVMDAETQRTYAEEGGIVTNQEVYESDLADSDEFRYMPAMAESSPHVKSYMTYPFSPAMLEVTERRLNEIVGGQLSIDEGLDVIAEALKGIVDEAGVG